MSYRNVMGLPSPDFAPELAVTLAELDLSL
jgi:hypothetical protein